MTKTYLKTPVALIVFNRFSPTKKVFEAVRNVRPSKLLIIADGPRPNHPQDMQACASVRSIFDNIDWECQVFKHYSNDNLGCGVRPATGIDWIFSHVDEAIILEDDCVPNHSFFYFCESLLQKYKHDERVMHISGTNSLFGVPKTNNSYFFSRYPFCWGWATWKRAWAKYDYDLKCWPENRESYIWKSFIDSNELSTVKFWQSVLDRTYESDKSHVWDFQWIFACWLNRGLSIIPGDNLISNVGFGSDATHTKPLYQYYQNVLSRFGASRGVIKYIGWPFEKFAGRFLVNKYSNMPVGDMEFPLLHPERIERDKDADRAFQFHNYEGGYLGGVKRLTKKLMLLNDGSS